ncbi:hypothetical protein ES703_13910 [subsurface metagenome]
MSNRKAPCRVVNIPAGFLPWIVQERDRYGDFTCTDTMGRILEKHFGKRPAPFPIVGIETGDKKPDKQKLPQAPKMIKEVEHEVSLP